MSSPQSKQVNYDDDLNDTEPNAKTENDLNIQTDNTLEEINLIPHRVFLNHVDSFHARHISSFLADQIFGATREGGGGGEGEEGEPEAEDEEVTKQDDLMAPYPPVKYEIIGTLNYSFHKKTEDILYTFSENDEDKFISEIMQCGFIIYDITKDPDEIPKALKTLTIIEQEIEKMRDVGPKYFKNLPEVRVFILISTVMTWALTKPIDPEDPELAFTEADYKKRKCHPNYKDHIACEREVVLKGRKYKDKLKTIVVAVGNTYGAEEDDIAVFFKMAWLNEKELPVFQGGKNFVPLLHVADLAKILHGLLESVPKKQYILAVEQTPCKLKQIIQTLSKAMGQRRIKETSAEEAFLYKDVNQSLFERCTVNLNMEPSFIVDDMEIEWKNELSLAENMGNIVSEFRIARNLKPLKIILHGPPTVGKTRLAKDLCEYYGLHYISTAAAIDETIANIREKIERQKLKIQAQEEKLQNAENEDEEETAEEEEEDEEGGDIEEWEQQIHDIENEISQSETGELPDEILIPLIKSLLQTNPCMNQGYVLDGYPETTQQTKELFGGAGGGGEGEGEGGDESGNKILPDRIISLQAPDDFLLNRIKSFTENQLLATNYTEEKMFEKLATYRINNTEDVTMLNFFDEIEIHPIVLDLTELGTSDDINESIFKLLTCTLGPPVTLGPTEEEELELAQLEEERQRLLEQEAKLLRELAERQAIEDHQNKMEMWAELLEKLQMEEEKILVAQGKPLRHYLMKFVFPTLTSGLLEVARIKPNDPVDFLAEYLFKENPEGHMFDPAYTREGKLVEENEVKEKENKIENK